MTNKMVVNEAISNFKIDPKTTKARPTQREIILGWCQENEKDLKHTTLTALARQILLPDYNISELHIRQTLHALTRLGLIISDTDKKGPTKRNFYLNYFHSRMPLDIVNLATPEQMAAVKKIVYGKQTPLTHQEFTLNEQIDSPVEPKASLAETWQHDGLEQQEPEQPESEQPESEQTTEQPTEISVDLPNEKQITISLTINLNLGKQ